MKLWQHNFLNRNKLGSAYLSRANQWFDPLIDTCTPSSISTDKAFIFGINGTHGSGKSTLADYLCELVKAQLGLTAVVLSLDDFYLTQQQRRQLGARVHPLLATRGVPGTHDVPLAIRTLDQLSSGHGELQLPRFDKRNDDRFADAQLTTIVAPVDVIILEGWCLGARPQSAIELQSPINRLERDQDAAGIWRAYVNNALAEHYQELFERVDCWIMLRAPSFKQVHQWRLEQELKLADTLNESDKNNASSIMNNQQIAHFILHYQRITEVLLRDLPASVDHLFQLDEAREIIEYRAQQPNRY